MLVMLGLATASTAPCRAEHAVYALRHAPTITAEFRGVARSEGFPTGLAIAIRFRRSGDVTWWLPWNGGTDDRQNVASTTDVAAPGWRLPDPDVDPRPNGDLEYLGFNSRYDIIDDVPRRGGPAPAHFLLKGIGQVEFDHGCGHFVPEDTKQLFDLTGCSSARR